MLTNGNQLALSNEICVLIAVLRKPLLSDQNSKARTKLPIHSCV